MMGLMIIMDVGLIAMGRGKGLLVQQMLKIDQFVPQTVMMDLYSFLKYVMTDPTTAKDVTALAQDQFLDGAVQEALKPQPQSAPLFAAMEDELAQKPVMTGTLQIPLDASLIASV